MDIGWARRALENGEKVARRGWNGKGIHLELHRGFEDTDGEGYEITAFVMICAVDGTYVPWTVSQTDFLAQDWELA